MNNVVKLPLANRLDEQIEGLNKEFAVISVGSSVKILQEVHDPETGATEIALLSVRDFDTMTLNRFNGDPEAESPSKFFLKHPGRRQYRKLDFYPGEVPKDVYNLWHGFAVKPAAGTTTRFWALVRDVICAGNDEAYHFVRKWLAHLVQRPAELPGTALVLRGKQGTGKNTFVDAIGKLLGPHYFTVNSLERLTGHFNGHLAHKLLVHANEAIWGGYKPSEGALKAMITDDELSCEFKGVDVTKMRNYKRVIVSSNEDWAVPRGADDRRFFVLDVSDAQKENQEYFGPIHEELGNGGYAALLHDLQNEDLAGFNPRKMPITGAGLDMKLKSANVTVRWLYELLDAGYDLKVGKFSHLTIQIAGESLEKDDVFEAYAHAGGDESRSQFFKILKQVIPEAQDVRKAANGGSGTRTRQIVFPPLQVARESIERYFKQPGMIPWSEPADTTLDMAETPTTKKALNSR
jgi:hypothetical protein